MLQGVASVTDVTVVISVAAVRAYIKNTLLALVGRMNIISQTERDI